MRSSFWGGCALLLAASVFLAANVVIGLAWQDPPYSWALHNISDLGNVTCGIWDTTRPRAVCSPWHAAMNASFAATGVLMALGIGLSWRFWAGGRVAQLLALAAAGGFGLAGWFPADVDENRHFLAALLIFVLGNAAMVVAGFVRRSPVLRAMRWISLVLGLIGVAGVVLFAAQVDVGIGVGGMERIAVFPFVGWLTEVGRRVVTD